MKLLAVALSVIALAAADVSHLGYRYNVPNTSYGVPAYKTGSDASSLGSHTANSGSSLFASTASQPQYQQSGYQNTGHQGYQGSSAGYQGQLGHSTTGGAFQTQGISEQHKYQEPSNQYIYSDAVQGNTGNLGQGSFNTQFNGASVNFHTSGVSQTQFQSLEKSSAQTLKEQKYYQVQHQAPQVFKHFYVHAAPEEPEVSQVRHVPVLPPPQKHYKVLFIKAPTTQPAAPIIPIQQQNEEKTIVYVLVNNQEEAKAAVVPHVAPTPPSKPEVFFIKYNNKEGSQAVINNIVQDFNAKNAGATLTHATGSETTSPVIHADGLSSGSVVSSSGSLSGGTSSSGSFSVNHGASEIGNNQFVNIPSIQEQSGHSFQTVASDSINQVGGGVANQQSGGYQSKQEESYRTVGATQGLPHTSYGPPNFRS